MRFEPFVRFSLAPSGGNGCGVWCDTDGVFIGPGIALVERGPNAEGCEFTVIPTDHLNKVLSVGYGAPFDATPYAPGLAKIATALGNGDFALANIALVQLRIPPFPSSDDSCVAAIADELLKARHELRWPKGTPPQGDGKAPGGQFRSGDANADDSIAGLGDNMPPKETPPQRTLTARERMLIAAGDTIQQIRAALGYVASIAVIIAQIRMHQPQELSNDALRAAHDPPKTMEQLRASQEDMGFRDMDEFERALGKAGSGYDWHHIVEQADDNIKEFGATAIHSTWNVIRVPTLIHREISAYYSMKDPAHPGYTRRSWLQTRSPDEQYDAGIEALRKFGVLK
jgi:hypothetical protein